MDKGDPIGGRARTVLVVEDDRVFGNALSAVIERCGLQPLLCERGDVALAMVAQYQPTGVVLDVRLPGIDGWGALDRLKHDPATAHIPVAVIAGDPGREYALRLGACAFAQKPAPLEVVEQLVASLDRLGATRERRVAIIDPRPKWRDALVESLEILGCDILALEGVADVRRAAQEKVDLVLADGASVEDPARFCGYAREIAARADLPIVAVSSARKNTAWIEPARAGALGGPYVLFVADLEQLVQEAAARLHRRPHDVPVERRAQWMAMRRADPALAATTVMVVDDDPRNVMAMTALLQSQRVDVVQAQSGASALELLARDSSVDAVLVDIMMPAMDGFETIRAIRALRRHARLPIVAVTAKAMKGDREACLAAGASDYVPKPIDADQLFSRLRLCLMR